MYDIEYVKSVSIILCFPISRLFNLNHLYVHIVYIYIQYSAEFYGVEEILQYVIFCVWTNDETGV